MILALQSQFLPRLVLVSLVLYLTACSLAPKTLPYSGELRLEPDTAVTSLPAEPVLTSGPARVVDEMPKGQEVQVKVDAPDKARALVPVISRHDAKPGYYLQVGAFSSEVNAQRMAQDIAETTRGAIVVVRDQHENGEVFYKPQAGPYPSLSAAVEGEVVLKQMGIAKPRFIRRSRSGSGVQ